MTELAVPGWHGAHAAALVAPMASLAVRAGQKMHADADAPPSMALKVPTPHAIHVLALTACTTVL